MIEPTEEMKAMARRVAVAAIKDDEHWIVWLKTDILAGKCDDWPIVQAALAAIIETTERCAETVEAEMPVIQCMSVEPVVSALQQAATAIRSGKQYGKE